jgi:DNA (cytosine-5)-methyltransferase 1
MKFVDFFAGIGGIRRGFEQAKMKSVGWVERDKYARKSYEAMHDVSGEWTKSDIRDVEAHDVPSADIWTAGFPCQDVSIAGKRAGLEGARSKLFYEVIRLAKDKKDKPRYIVFENVKGLLSIDGGWGFYRVLAALDEIGYNAEWQALNTKNFGLPQNRERVFIIAAIRNSDLKCFPIHGETDGKLIQLNDRNVSQRNRIYSTDGIARCLMSAGGGGGTQTGWYKIDKVRTLTPLECFRLQGFTDEDHAKASNVCSNNQLYKQVGNAVSVNVAFAIGKRIMEVNNAY